MKATPRVGLWGRLDVVVGPENRISFADGRMPAVLATPWLVAYLEYAARDALAEYLDEHERSVGIYLEIEHLAPAPEGAKVACLSRVIHTDGPVVTFQVEARDAVDVLARGIHKRKVIDVDRFARRLARKKSKLEGS
jgi:fluoroacetyl-CoA thioesterase